MLSWTSKAFKTKQLFKKLKPKDSIFLGYSRANCLLVLVVQESHTDLISSSARLFLPSKAC